MGGWKLEVGKMVVYMAFPVALFHYFNQPQLYEEWVTRIKREVYPPENKEKSAKLRAIIQEVKQKRNLEVLKNYEEKSENIK